MTEAATVLVDSNVIIDIVGHDPQWAAWSQATLSAYEHEQAVVNPIVFAELCYQKTSADEVTGVLAALGIAYAELPREALFLAAQAFRIYRQQGGVKTSPLSDFFIGAHAAAEGWSLITRDTARYQTYFPSVTLICPP